VGVSGTITLILEGKGSDGANIGIGDSGKIGLPPPQNKSSKKPKTDHLNIAPKLDKKTSLGNLNSNLYTSNQVISTK
jgi:hypothetical protein